MVEVLFLMFSGIITGYLFRKRKKLIRFVESLLVWIIFLLLFFMGLSIGRDPVIINNLPSLGLTAVLISIGAISGSLVLALIVWNVFFRKKNGQVDES